jgi:hypothetical protein
MLLQDKKLGALIEVLDLEKLFDPHQESIPGRVQFGEEEQDPAPAMKADLKFPSGEELPRCWIDADYQFEEK